MTNSINIAVGQRAIGGETIIAYDTKALKHNRKFANWVKGGPGEKLPAFRREKLFIDLLETVHPKDAELLCNMIDKKQPAKGITKKLVQEAYPGLILK